MKTTVTSYWYWDKRTAVVKFDNWDCTIETEYVDWDNLISTGIRVQEINSNDNDEEIANYLIEKIEDVLGWNNFHEFINNQYELLNAYI